MNRSRLMIVMAILLAWSAADSLVANESVMDSRLVDAEHIYRTDGPAMALPEFERLLPVFQEADDRSSEAVAYGFVGACQWRLGDFDQARLNLDRSLALSRETGNRLQEGKALNLLGLLEWDLGNFEAAIDRFTRASAIGKQAGDARLEGATLNNLSLVYDELGDYRTSLDQYQQVLDIYSNADFPRGMGDTLGNIGGVYLLLGRFTEAERYYSQALAISEKLDSVAAMSQDHGNLGMAWSGMGDAQKAIEHFDRALALAGKAGMQKEQGQWLRGRANAHVMSGRYDLGLRDHESALAVLESVGVQAQLLDALRDLGELQLMLGDPMSAEQYFHRAMALAQSMDVPRVVALSQLSLGDLQFRHRRPDAAAAQYLQALQRAKTAGERTIQCQALLRLARVHRDQGRFEEGWRASRLALETAREIGARALGAEALFMQAEMDRTRGATDAALQQYERAGLMSAEIGDPDLQWQILFGRAMALEPAGRIEEAVDALQAAVRIIEGVRSQLREKRYRSGYLQDKQQVYVELVRMQNILSRTSEAFATAERLRDWSYFEQTGFAGWSELSREQQRQRFELRERIRKLQESLDHERSREPPESRQLAIDTFSEELMLAERDFQALLDDIGADTISPEAPVGRWDESIVQRRLRPNQVLIEYVLGTHNVTIFVLSGTWLRTLEIPTDRANLHSRLDLLRDLLRQRDNDRWKTPARSLADTLIQPVLDTGWLEEAEHLYLVPHGMLHYLPYALLPVDAKTKGHALVENFTLTYLPSASSLTKAEPIRLRPPNLLALAPATSRLEYAMEEARSVTSLFEPNAELLLGEQATESSFKSSAGRFGILHLATHGYFNKLNPLLSGLQLEPDDANDGLLEVHEILELHLDSSLVTLSACKTGLASGYFSAIPAGDDFVGMTRAFLQVGSASVLATLWEVEDRSTVELMKAFYGDLNNSHDVPDNAMALARAQRVLMASKTYKHPYYWAPFVMVGSADVNNGTKG